MIEIIQTLLDKGIAYRGHDGSIYFSIRKFPSYGRLSHLHLDELKEGASGDITPEDEYGKENVADFVLWKTYDEKRDGHIFWESPYGRGRPGWHIECSAMAMKLLGESIDIHVGGVDNMFPHHENEIAQSEGCSQKHFVRYWLHAEHLLVDHKKMSKSLGNFYTLRDLLKRGYSGAEVRYMLLQTHYRTQLNFTLPGLDAAVASLKRLADFIQRLKEQQGEKTSGEAEKVIQKTAEAFRAALSEDINISVALASLFDMVREVNGLIDQGKIGKKDAAKVIEFLEEIDRVLGVLPLQAQEIDIPQELQDALEKRQTARREKNWAMADHYRDFILSKGYTIEDTSVGARLKK
jgi:cysteinyl-tRNA synthetase